LCGKVFGFVRRNLSGAQRRKDADSGQRGAGKGGRPCPASAHRNPEPCFWVPSFVTRFETKLHRICY
jgi:hypothetical protein